MIKRLLTLGCTFVTVCLFACVAYAGPTPHGNANDNNVDWHHAYHMNTNKMMNGDNGTMTYMYRHNFRNGLGPQHYHMFDVDISNDLFINPTRFKQFTGGMDFIDENGDGVVDIVQNTRYFQKLGIGPCRDENNDTICDCFETIDAYKRMGMHNFVDVDGDGLCDNYEMNPFITDSN